MSEFNDKGADVVAVSTDSQFSHKAWLGTPRKQGGIEGCLYPIASDFTKKTTEAYGVLEENLGVALRGLFLIDPKGVVQHASVNNLPVGRSVTEMLKTGASAETGRASSPSKATASAELAATLRSTQRR